MKKNPMSDQMVVSHKTSINPNIPSFVPQTYQWRPPPITPLTLQPSVSGPPPYWPAMAPNYPYFSHQMNPRFGPHSNHCCLANAYNQRTVCQNCHQWTNNFQQWIPREVDNSHNNSNSNGTVESITEVQTDESDNDLTHMSSNNSINSNPKESESQKEIKHLRAVNEVLKLSLDESTQQLKQTQELMIKLSEKFSNDYIEKYRQNLKKYGDFIREECNRFYRNEGILKKLTPIVEQIRIASNVAKEVKETVRQTITDTENSLKLESKPNLDVLSFDYNSLPEFPDLMLFYKNILDEIPLIFCADLSQLKRLTNNFIQSKNKFSDPLVADSLPFGDELNSLPTSQSFLSAPDIQDLPKPDLSLFGQRDNIVLPLRSPDPNVLASALPLNSLPNTSSPLLNGLNPKQPKEKSISPIGQPFSDSKSIGAESQSNVNKIQNDLQPIGEPLPVSSNQTPAESILRAPRKNPFAPIGSKAPKAVPNTRVELSKPVPMPALTQAQTKLLAKLKEKYNHLSDEILIDSMAQTKSSLIASGVSGFSGMKVSDIINKISEYIEREVILMNKFSREKKSMPSLKHMFNSSTNESQTDGNRVQQKVEIKGWNIMGPKSGTNNESICAICFETINRNKFKTECNHFFHHLCIKNWLVTDGSCPTCRSLVLAPEEYPQL